jgi:ABC-type branched-subunit amino acid transport system ATPase component/ABC-type branched-subunit amino acid transport system permease subunit
MRNRIITTVFILILAAIPAIPAVPAYWVTLLNYIGLYTIVALGLVLLTGVAGLTSFGQAAFVGLGAYTTAYLTTVYAVSPWLTLLIGFVITGLCAYLIGVITLHLSGHYLPLSTIAWGISLYYLFSNMAWLGAHDGLMGIPSLNLFGWALTNRRSYYCLIWLFVLISIVVTQNLLDSRPGRAIRALKGGGVMAESCGVQTDHYKIVIFVYAALLASLSGWLYAHLQGAVSPSPFSAEMGIEYLFMVVIGGAGNVWGALLGAGIVTILKDVLQDILPKLFGESGNFEIIAFGILVVLIMQYTRQGLWPYLLQLFPGNTTKTAPPEAPALPRREMPKSGEMVLDVRSVRKEFGGLVAVKDLCFQVRAGEIIGLIGPNGAGKSTTFNLVTGLFQATGGEVIFRGQRIDRLRSPQIAQLGIGRTFQQVRLLPSMTVLENVVIGAHQRTKNGLLAAMLRLDRAQEAQLFHEAVRQLERVGLGAYLHEQAGNLALGQQRILEIARALCCNPLLLLLDEPAAGLRYREKQELAAVLRQLQAEGMSILLVEHDMDFVMGVTDRLVVMEFGIKLAEGLPQEIQTNPAVLEAYLGGDD